MAVAVRNFDSFDEALSFSLQCLSCSELTLKPEQREILVCLFDKQSVFAWLPTGYGKSICYQALPFLLSSTQSSDSYFTPRFSYGGADMCPT